jgi:hypothetical protein
LNSSQSTFSTASDLLKAISNVDILIDETFIGSNLTAFLANYQIAAADQSKYKFLANKKVYREDGILTASGGYDWFEAPVAMADALLEDMINAVNPNAPTGSFTRNWLRNIMLNETIKYASDANCSWSETEPRPNLATQFNGAAFTLTSPNSTAPTTTSGANSLVSTKNIAGALLVSLASLAYLA